MLFEQYQSIYVPSKGSYIEYDRVAKAKFDSTLPIIGFADFETVLASLNSDENGTNICFNCTPNLECRCFS